MWPRTHGWGELTEPRGEPIDVILLNGIVSQDPLNSCPYPTTLGLRQRSFLVQWSRLRQKLTTGQSAEKKGQWGVVSHTWDI